MSQAVVMNGSSGAQWREVSDDEADELCERFDCDRLEPAERASLVIDPDGRPAYRDLSSGHVQWLTERPSKARRSRSPRTDLKVVGDAAPSRRLTDVGNAGRLVARHGHELRYCPELGWLAWDGTRWARDTAGRVRELAKATAASIYEEAAVADDSQARKETAKWAATSESAGRINAMVDLARSDPTVVVDIGKLDADPWMLNTPTGLVDLRTGDVWPNDPAALCTKVTAAGFDPSAPEPARWRAFLERVQPDDEARAFLARASGYSITGTVTEHMLLVNHGKGANGKTVFTSVVGALLGDYAGPVPADVLLAHRSDTHPEVIAALRGLRFAVIAETPEGARLNEPRLKALTGGDQLVARPLYGHYFTFAPTHCMWLHTNHRPEIAGTDEGIWRRIRLVPWAVTIPDDERDRDLAGRLITTEGPGILRWLVAGCLDWQRHGLAAPKDVADATAAYRHDSDHLAAFLTEETLTIDGAPPVPSDQLHRAYEHWCKTNGEDALTLRAFGLALKERGYTNRPHGPSRRKHWFGLALLTSERDPTEEVNPCRT